MTMYVLQNHPYPSIRDLRSSSLTVPHRWLWVYRKRRFACWRNNSNLWKQSLLEWFGDSNPNLLKPVYCLVLYVLCRRRTLHPSDKIQKARKKFIKGLVQKIYINIATFVLGRGVLKGVGNYPKYRYNVVCILHPPSNAWMHQSR